MEDSREPGGFLHSGTFLLVDTERRIRGVYDGTDELEISKIKNDIRILLKSNVY
jgi:protein SCO1/2